MNGFDDASHTIALAILSVVLVGQLLASWRLSSLMKAAARVTASDKATPSSRHARLRGYRWAEWCRDYESEPAPRQCILAEMRAWTEASPPYAFLQRTGVMAPLLGVVVTAVGLFHLRAPDTRGGISPQYVLDAMKPLAIGIGGGAVIALVNQLLILLAESRYRRLESVANDVLDMKHSADPTHAQARPLPREAQRVLAALESALSPLTTVLADTGARLRESAALTDRFDVATRQFEKVASLLDATAAHQQSATLAYTESLEAVVLPSQKAMQTTASRISAASKSLAEPIESLLEVLRTLVASSQEGIQRFGTLHTGVAEFARTLGEDVAPVFHQYRNAATSMENAASLSHASAVDFVKSVSELTRGFQYHRDAADRMMELVDQRAVPAFEVLARSTHVFEEAANALTEQIDRLHTASFDQVNNARQMTDTFAGAADGLKDAVRCVSDASETLSAAVSQHDGLFRSVRQLSDGFSPLLTGLDDIGVALKAGVAQQREITDAASRSIADAAEGAKRLLLMSDHIESTVSNIRSATTSLSEALRRLESANDGEAEHIEIAMRPLIAVITRLSTAVEEAGTRRGGWLPGRLIGG
jgi:hypothetical protein